MKLRKILIPLFFSIILNDYRSPLLWAAPEIRFSIVYTNDVMGEVEPCG